MLHKPLSPVYIREVVGVVQPVSISSWRWGPKGCWEAPVWSWWWKTGPNQLVDTVDISIYIYIYICPLGLPALMQWAQRYFTPILISSTFSFWSFVLPSYFSFYSFLIFSPSKSFCQCVSCLQMREKNKNGGFGGEEPSSGHFWASDKGMKELLAALSNCGWCFCDVGYVTSHLGGSRGQTHPLTYFPEHICSEDRRNLLKREHGHVSVPWRSSKLAV